MYLVCISYIRMRFLFTKYVKKSSTEFQPISDSHGVMVSTDTSMDNVAEWEFQNETMEIDKEDHPVHSTCREQPSDGAFSGVKSDFEFIRNPAVQSAVTYSCANSGLDVELPGTDGYPNEDLLGKSRVSKHIGKNLYQGVFS